MTHQQYDQWLSSRSEIAKKAVEPASMLGLAGEMQVLTYQQPDVNKVATQQIHMIEKEQLELAHDDMTMDFTERQSEFSQMLTHIDDEV